MTSKRCSTGNHPVKVIHQGKSFCIDIEQVDTLGEFLNKAALSFGDIDKECAQLFVGYPPQKIRAKPTDRLSSWGITKGITVTLRSGDASGASLLPDDCQADCERDPCDSETINMSRSAGLSQEENGAAGDPIWRKAVEFVLGEGGVCDANSQQVVTEVYDQLKREAVSQPNAKVNQFSATASPKPVSEPLPRNMDEEDTSFTVDANRVVVPANNSCLFTALGYLLEPDRVDIGNVSSIEGMQEKLREVVARYIAQKPLEYDSSVLGMSPSEYCRWIQDPRHWGGEIELSVLCIHYRAEICVVEISSGHVYRYAPAEMSSSDSSTATPGRRAYLLYDGVHYDPIELSIARSDCVSSSRGESTGSVLTGICAHNRQGFVGTCNGCLEIEPEGCHSRIASQAETSCRTLAEQLRQKGQYTSLPSGDCTIQCSVCYRRCGGQTEAMQHARATGHQNFRQIT